MSEIKKKNKELKEEEVKKVRGGSSWLEEVDDDREKCPHCRNWYDPRDMKIIDGRKYCPYCKKEIESIKL